MCNEVNSTSLFSFFHRADLHFSSNDLLKKESIKQMFPPEG